MKRHHNDSLFKLIRDAVIGDPLHKQWERVEEALKRYAEAVGRERTVTLQAAFFTTHVTNLNPNYDWRLFADAKDSQVEFVRARCEQRAQLHKLQRAVEEEYETYMKLKNGDSNATAAAIATIAACTSIHWQRSGRAKRATAVTAAAANN